MTIVPFCKCRHLAVLHHYGESGEECRPSCGCREFRLDPRSRLCDEPDPTWDEALADFQAAEPATVIQPHVFAEAIQADLDICWCGKGAGHLIHRAATDEGAA